MTESCSSELIIFDRPAGLSELIKSGILSAIPCNKNSIRLGSDDFLATRGIELGFFSLICKHPARACCLGDLLVCLLFNLLGCLSARRTRLLPAAVKCLTSVIASSLHLIPGRGYVNSYGDFKSRLPLRSDDLLVTFAQPRVMS